MSWYIRTACLADIPAILAIYSHYVRNTVVTFEEHVPTEEAFAAKMQGILQRYPYLVLEKDDKLVGYAYASAYREKSAYRWDVELTIYIAPEETGHGAGRVLYQTLLELLSLQRYRNAYACLTYPNLPSQKMHLRLGFAECGHFLGSGYKFGQWLDDVWLAKALQAEDSPLEEPIPFPQLHSESIQTVLDAANYVFCEGGCCDERNDIS